MAKTIENIKRRLTNAIAYRRELQSKGNLSEFELGRLEGCEDAIVRYRQELKDRGVQLDPFCG
jgi:hypothetical protein